MVLGTSNRLQRDVGSCLGPDTPLSLRWPCVSVKARVPETLQSSSLLGLVFWLGFFLGFLKRYYIGGFRQTLYTSSVISPEPFVKLAKLGGGFRV